MEVEWTRTIPGKLGLDPFVEALYSAGAPMHSTNLVWEFRRANLKYDEITYKFDSTDDRDEVRGLYERDISDAYVVIAMFPPDTRDITALVHMAYDGKQTRLRVESPSLRYLERLKAELA